MKDDEIRKILSESTTNPIIINGDRDTVTRLHEFAKNQGWNSSHSFDVKNDRVYVKWNCSKKGGEVIAQVSIEGKF